MDDKVRLIDAEALKNYMCSTCPNKERCEDTEQVCSAILDVDEQPTIEAVTREHFIKEAKELITAFVGSGEKTEESRIIFALVFGNLELRLFGSRDGDSE